MKYTAMNDEFSLLTYPEKDSMKSCLHSVTFQRTCALPLSVSLPFENVTYTEGGMNQISSHSLVLCHFMVVYLFIVKVELYCYCFCDWYGVLAAWHIGFLCWNLISRLAGVVLGCYICVVWVRT
jgi:hypothetical protein